MNMSIAYTGRSGKPQLIKSNREFQTQKHYQSFTFINQGNTPVLLDGVDIMQPGEYRIFSEFQESEARLDRISIEFDDSGIVPPIVANNRLVVWFDLKERNPLNP